MFVGEIGKTVRYPKVLLNIILKPSCHCMLTSFKPPPYTSLEDMAALILKLCTLFNSLHGNSNVLLPSGTCSICLTLSGSLPSRQVIKFSLELQPVVSYTYVDRTEQQLQDDTHCLYSQFSAKHENIMTRQILYHKKWVPDSNLSVGVTSYATSLFECVFRYKSLATANNIM